MSTTDKQCYICYNNRTRNMLRDVPVCEGCMKLHFSDLEEKKEEPINLDLKLNWDTEDTEPMWANFIKGD